MRLFASLSALVVLALAPVVASATTFTDNFSSDTYLLTATTAGTFQTIDGTNIDVLNGPPFGYLCTGVATCVDIGGTGGAYQGVLESSTTFAAGLYRLSFVLTGSGRGPDASTLVTFGNYDHTFDLTSSDVTSGVVSNQLVTLTSAGYLAFTYETGAYNIGNVLDSVSVNSTAAFLPFLPGAETPEPSSLVLLGSGLVAGARMLAGRRRSV